VFNQRRHWITKIAREAVAHFAGEQVEKDNAMTFHNSAALATAINYIRRGWAPIPLPRGKKAPNNDYWPQFRATEENAHKHFHDPMNVSVILGQASGGLVDIDIDCSEALALADKYLPETGSEFGRLSKRRSHRLYKVTGPVPSVTFVHPKTKKTIIELRGDKTDGSPGKQTVFPGSLHPSGEAIEWDKDGELAVVTYDELKRDCAHIAALVVCAGRNLSELDAEERDAILLWAGKQPAPRASTPETIDHQLRGGLPNGAKNRAEAYAATALDEECEKIARTAEGSRNDTLNKAAFSLGQLVGGGLLQEDAARARLFQAAEQCGLVKDEGATAAHATITSGLQAGMQQPRGLPPTGEPSPTPDANDAALTAEEKAELKRLAGLAPVLYFRERKEAANKFGVPVKMLDEMVDRYRGDEGEGEVENKQGTALRLVEPEPWPEPVVGHQLLQELIQAIRRYVVLPTKADATATALWVIHTYVFDLFMITPRLGVSSPEKRCGKTTKLDVLDQLVNRALTTVGISAAAIFRTIEKAKPTLLIDEGDNMFGKKGDDGVRDILAILNSGHRRGGRVIRTVGEDHDPRAFSTFAPAAIALIGKMPDTLLDRSIEIRLRRKLVSDKVESFRADRLDDLKTVARKIRRWCDDNHYRLRASDPDMPTGLFNRVADNWRPLLAIADAIGCGDEARKVAVELASRNADDDSIGVMLLSDISLTFKEKGVGKLASESIIDFLVNLDGRPWADLRRGKPIDKNWLARKLKPFSVTPEPEAFEYYDAIGRQKRGRGYLMKSFDDAFGRYLSHAIKEGVEEKEQASCSVDPPI
jgi:putative DNA primase/helicase